MNQKEKELFFELCRYRDQNPQKLRNLIKKGAATPAVLGHLFYNRMGGIAFGVLKENGLLGETNREFRNTLESRYVLNREKNESYFRCLKLLTRVLKGCEGKYALLKGAYLCKAYPEGFRTSNDIDILTTAENIGVISQRHKDAGFRQGSVQNGCFLPASRQEIIRSRLMRGETVPFIKEVNLPFLRYLEIDINFSLSYKNEKSDTVREFLSRSRRVNLEKLRICTLEPCDFLLHLCGHLYKEAAVYPWVQMKRDMTLYKYCDLYTMLQDITEKEYAVLEKRASTLGLEEGCYYALYCTKVLFSLQSDALSAFLTRIAPANREILKTVIDPEAKKKYRYLEDNLFKRFFQNDRLSLLEEVFPDEKAGII